MGKGEYLGEFELTVMLALARSRRPASGRQVYQEIVATTGREVAVASVHVTLNRLEEKGLVGASMAAGPEGLGRDIKHFALNPSGLASLRDSRDYWDRLWSGADLPGEVRQK